MKTVRFTNPLFTTLLVLVFSFALMPDAAAQDKLYYNPAGRGHWKLSTDPVNRNTTVKFFDENNQLIYEEVLPNRYVKLTDRNVALMSRTLDQMVKNRLVLDHIKSTVLPADKRGLAGDKGKRATEADITEVAKDDKSTFGIRVTFVPVENTTKFKLLFENPARSRIDVQLEDENFRLLYAETINSPGYKRSFDLQSLPMATYTLRVMTLDRKYKYTKQIV